MTTDNPYEEVRANLREIMGGSFSRVLPTSRTDEREMRSSTYVLANEGGGEGHGVEGHLPLILPVLIWAACPA